MIKYIKNDCITTLEASGDLLQAAVDVGYLVAQIYHRIAIPEAREQFKSDVQTLIGDRSPIWNKKMMVRGDVDESCTFDRDEMIRQAGAGK